MSKFPGDAYHCLSADTVENDYDTEYYNVCAETLNAMNHIPGIPLHRLILKKNVPVMLLRNLSQADGLCNGTRLLVKEVINGRLQVASIMAPGQKHHDKVVLIPRIKLIPEDTTLPYIWSRRQFPVRVAFAMTIDKSQGQTLQRVGVYLKSECFSHGQLYVAASRVGTPTNIKFAADKDDAGEFRTINVVWQDALTDV